MYRRSAAFKGILPNILIYIWLRKNWIKALIWFHKHSIIIIYPRRVCDRDIVYNIPLAVFSRKRFNINIQYNYYYATSVIIIIDHRIYKSSALHCRTSKTDNFISYFFSHTYLHRYILGTLRFDHIRREMTSRRIL